MTPAQQEKLNQDYATYREEAAKMAAEGKAIGTFSGWAHDRKLIVVETTKRGRSA